MKHIPQFHKITYDALTNLAGTVLPILAALLAIPKILAMIGTERFGALSLLWMLIGYANLLDFGFGLSLTKVLAECEIEGGTLQDISTMNWDVQLLLLSIGAVIATATLPLLAGPGIQILHFTTGVSAELKQSGIWVAMSLPFVVSTSGLRGAIMASHEFLQINISRGLSGMLTFLVPLALASKGQGLPAMAFGLFLTRVLNWSYHLAILRYHLPWLRLPRFPTILKIRELMHTAGWLSVSNLASAAKVSLDRFLIGYFLNGTSIAYYSAPYDVLSKLWLIPNAITPVLFPILVKDNALRSGGMKETYATSELTLLGITFPICLLLACFARPLLGGWLGPTFALKAAPVAVFLTIGFFINISAHIPFTTLQAMGHARQAAIFQSVQVPLFVILIITGAILGGVEGVAIAFAIRMVVDASYFVTYGNYYVGLNRSFTAKVFSLMTIGVISMISVAFSFSGWWKILGLSISSGLFFSIGIWIFRFIRSEQAVKTHGSPT